MKTLAEQCAARKQANIARNKRTTALKISRAQRSSYVRQEKARRELINNNRSKQDG